MTGYGYNCSTPRAFTVTRICQYPCFEEAAVDATVDVYERQSINFRACLHSFSFLEFPSPAFNSHHSILISICSFLLQIPHHIHLFHQQTLRHSNHDFPLAESERCIVLPHDPHEHQRNTRSEFSPAHNYKYARSFYQYLLTFCGVGRMVCSRKASWIQERRSCTEEIRADQEEVSESRS